MVEKSCKEILQEHVPPVECPLEFFLDLSGQAIEIHTNSFDLYSGLKHYFRYFPGMKTDDPIVVHALETDHFLLSGGYTQKLPERGKNKIKEEFIELRDGRIIRKKNSGMVFIVGLEHNLAIGPCSRNMNQVINFINSRYMESMLNKNMILGHAAGVKYGDGGLALAGFSGKGKSTLALHIMREGSTFVSNDRLLIGANGRKQRMHGTPKLPRINPGTALNNDRLQQIVPRKDRKRYSELPPHKLWTLEDKYDVYIDQCFGSDQFELCSDYEGLVILNWELNGGKMDFHQVDIKKRRDLLPAFMKDPGLFFFPDNPGIPDLSPKAYINMLSCRPVFEISGGIDFTAASKKCMQFLKG